MRVRSVRYHSGLSGFTRTLQVAGGNSSVSTGATAVASAETISSSNLCVWPDINCSTTSYSGMKDTLGISVKLAGTAVTLASGTVLATVILERRSGVSGGFDRETYTITFTLQDKVEPPVYTCTISDYDATITLPSVSLNDLVNNGVGKYAAISKPLNLNLQCNDNTDVAITFNATVLSGTDNAIKNLMAGNDNVGFQLFYGGNPVKVNNAHLIRTGASGATNLKFDVYYYYKGSGAITPGAIKSSAEFTLDYQ
ncbi:fimbrial protein [Yokenella regensburgei]